MENNGKANAMETLKVKVLALKEKWNPPVWALVLLAVWAAIPMAGGSMALYSALIGAPPMVWFLASVGVASYAYLLYKGAYGFLKKLEQELSRDEEEEN